MNSRRCGRLRWLLNINMLESGIYMAIIRSCCLTIYQCILLFGNATQVIVINGIFSQSVDLSEMSFG